MISSGINLVMTVIGFLVSTMFIVFVCTRLIWARIQLSASRRSLARTSRSDLTVMGSSLHGLEPLIVSKLPMRKYKERCLSLKENTQCTICLSEYHQEDTLKILPVYRHSFHAMCIDIWFQQHSTCPVCRISIRELSEKNGSCNPCSAQPRDPSTVCSTSIHITVIAWQTTRDVHLDPIATKPLTPCSRRWEWQQGIGFVSRLFLTI